MLFVATDGLKIKYLLSKISTSTKTGIVELSNQKGGIEPIIAFRLELISSWLANLISLLPNSCLKLRALIFLSQCVVTR